LPVKGLGLLIFPNKPLSRVSEEYYLETLAGFGFEIINKEQFIF